VVFLTVVIVLAVLTAAAAVTVRYQQRKVAKANEVVPGVAASAPKSWAGSHDPEALLHRRLRDAVAALRKIPWLSDVALDDARRHVERAALDIDDRLVAVAALPPARRDEPLAHLTQAVVAIEDTVSAMAVRPADETKELEAATSALDDHFTIIANANAELDRLGL
jgi:hypothetical protein